MSKAERRTFVALVEDVPGVLARVASLFRRRNFNIESLSVGRTHEPGVSRMTFVVIGDDRMGRMVRANLYKLIDVIRVDDVTHQSHVTRDIALIRVRATPAQRAEVIQVAGVFRARVVDVSHETLMIEVTGNEDKIRGLVALLEPFGVVEMVQAGTIAMTRGLARTSGDDLVHHDDRLSPEDLRALEETNDLERLSTSKSDHEAA